MTLAPTPVRGSSTLNAAKLVAGLLAVTALGAVFEPSVWRFLFIDAYPTWRALAFAVYVSFTTGLGALVFFVLLLAVQMPLAGLFLSTRTVDTPPSSRDIALCIVVFVIAAVGTYQWFPDFKSVRTPSACYDRQGAHDC